MDTLKDKIKSYYTANNKTVKEHTIDNYIYNIKALSNNLEDFKDADKITKKIDNYNSYMKKSVAYHSIIIALFHTGIIKDKDIQDKYNDKFRLLKASSKLSIGAVKSDKEKISMKTTLNDIRNKIKHLYHEYFNEGVKNEKKLAEILILEFHLHYPIRGELKTIVFKEKDTGLESEGNYYDADTKTVYIKQHKTHKRYGDIVIKVNDKIASLIELIHKYTGSKYILGKKYKEINTTLKRLLNNPAITTSTIRKINVSESLKGVDLNNPYMKHSIGTKLQWYYRTD